MAHKRALPPLVKAKMSPPQMRDACLRPQTLELLEESLRRRVTLICAPAGYGKTTVTLEAIRRCRLRPVWYKLDVLDQDPVSLIASLVEALAALYEGFGQTIRDRLANAHDVPYPVEQMTAEFVAEATDTITADIHIVLDDYHEAADSRALNVTLDYLVSNLPWTVRFVILSRYEPAFEVGKLRLNGQLGIVGVDDLRFGPEQVAEVVGSLADTVLSRERASALGELTEGWPASIVLAALAAQWVGVERLESALSDPRLKQDVFSYLAEQVYARESPEVKAFLRRTCCLDYVSVGLAKHVGAPRRAHRILAHLLSKGVFTFATEQEGTFRYHSLFREFLRQKTIQEDGPDRFHRLQLATADALEAHGDAERAVDLCLAANEPHLGLAVVARAGEKTLDGFRSDTLETWIERLPDDLRHSEPWAQLIAGEVDMRAGRFDAALGHVNSAIELLEMAGDRRSLYRALSARERTLFWKGDTTEAAEACRRALEVADHSEQKVHTLISLGAALNAECRWAEANKALTAAREVAGGSLPAEQARLAAQTVFSAGNAGRYREATKAADDAFVTLAEHGSPSLRAASLTVAGATRLFMADWAGARRDLDDARQLGARYGYVFLQALVDDVDGQLFSCVGDVGRAAAARDRAVEAPSIANDPYCLSMAVCHAGTAARRCGNRREAMRQYARAAKIACGTTARHAYLNASANLAFARGVPESALRKELADIAHEAHTLDLLFIALKAEFFAAVLQYRDGEHAEAVNSLLRCVREQIEAGHLNFLAQELVLEPRITTDLISAIDDEDVVFSLVNLLAHHWNGLALLIACLDLGTAPGVAATRAAVAHRTEAEITSVLAKAGKSPYPEVRTSASSLRRKRRTSRCRSVRDALGLTPREVQLLAMISEGVTNQDIATRLVLSPATVKTHVNHIFAKLGVRDRLQAALAYAKAKNEGLEDEESAGPQTPMRSKDTTVG